MRRFASLIIAISLLLAAAPCWAGWRQDLDQAQKAARAGRTSQAINYFQRTLRDSALPRGHRAAVYYNLGNLYQRMSGSAAQRAAYKDKALAAYGQAVALDPGYAKAYNNRGNLYRSQGRLSNAINDYTRAIRADRNYAPAWRNRSIAYEKRDLLAKALADAKVYLRLKPGDSRERQRLARLEQKSAAQQNKAPQALRLAQAGHAAMRRGDYNKALDYFNQALVLRSLSLHAQSRTYANQGTCWYKLEHFAKAAQSYGRAVAADPKFTAAYRDRGIAYIRLKDYRRAISDFSSALRRDPRMASAYYHRALAYWSCRDFARAQSDLNRYLKLQPSDAQARRILQQVRAGKAANYRH